VSGYNGNPWYRCATYGNVPNGAWGKNGCGAHLRLIFGQRDIGLGYDGVPDPGLVITDRGWSFTPSTGGRTSGNEDFSYSWLVAQLRQCPTECIPCLRIDGNPAAGGVRYCSD